MTDTTPEAVAKRVRSLRNLSHPSPSDRATADLLEALAARLVEVEAERDGFYSDWDAALNLTNKIAGLMLRMDADRLAQAVRAEAAEAERDALSMKLAEREAQVARLLEMQGDQDQALNDVTAERDELDFILHEGGPDSVANLIAERDTALAEVQRLRTAQGAAGETFYIDCEFDGHDGPLLSMAMVREDGWSLHVDVADVAVEDPWVLANVVPILGAHKADLACRVRPREVGRQLRHFIGDCQRPTIIADSPVDIGRFCRAISTGEDGGWASTGYASMTFIVRNVDCYPTKMEGAVRHNAWWDAMVLRALTQETPDGQ